MLDDELVVSDRSSILTDTRVRVAVNGFGRIGRCVTRQIVANPLLELVAINDLVQDLGNLTYLYNFDSSYGHAQAKAVDLQEETRSFKINNEKVYCFNEPTIQDVPWETLGVDIVVEATGVASNVEGSHLLIRQQRVRKVVVTHCPSTPVDLHLIIGLNEESYTPLDHHVVACGICDANAIIHPIVHLDSCFGIEDGFVTTLHPWLSYQNLVDSPTIMQSEPTHFWRDYGLGRSSVGTLIPKDTTAVMALKPIIPDLASRFDALSYRVPTSVVASADLTIRLTKNPGLEGLRSSLEELAAASRVVDLNYESLVAIDYLGSTASVTIDMQWLKSKGELVKLLVWYDNEWGYSARVVDAVLHLGLKL